METVTHICQVKIYCLKVVSGLEYEIMNMMLFIKCLKSIKVLKIGASCFCRGLRGNSALGAFDNITVKKLYSSICVVCRTNSKLS